MIGSDMERPGNVRPWFRITRDLAKDAVFFGLLGLVCGVVQVLGYRYFDQANFGNELLQEHIAFHSLVLMGAFVWLGKALVVWLPKLGQKERVSAVLEHLVARTVAFGSVATCVVLGFAASAVIFGAYFHAAKFAQAALYLASVAEVAANPVRWSEVSGGYFLAFGMIVVTPFMY